MNTLTCQMCAGDYEGQGWPHSLNLEFQAVMNHLLWVLIRRFRSLEEQLALLSSELYLQPGIVSTSLRYQIFYSKSPFI